MYQTGMSGKYHTSLVHVTSGFHNCIWDCFHLDDGEAILQAETYNRCWIYFTAVKIPH